MKRIFGLLFLLTYTFTVDAQSWKAYYDSTQLFWSKDWNKTVELLKHAEQLAALDLGIYDENYLTIINDLGLAYWRIKDYANAERLLQQSLRIKTEIYPAQNAELSSTLSNLAGLYVDQGNWHKSKEFYKKVVFEKPTDSTLYVSTAQNLISLYEKLHQSDSALRILNYVEARNIISGNTTSYYEWLLTKSRINRRLKNYKESEKISQELKDRFSSDPALTNSILLAKNLLNLGTLHLETGYFSKAERHFLEAYRTLKANHPNENILTIDALNNLAMVYEKLNIYDKAIAYYNQSLSLCNLSYGINALPCITLKNNIAGILLKQGHVAQAIESYETIFESYKVLIPESDPLFITTLNNLANAYRRNNEYDKAYKHLRWAFELIEVNHFENDDLNASIQNNLAVVYTYKRDFKNAALFYENALNIKDKIYGGESVTLIDIVSNLALVYWAMDKPDKAIPLLNKSLALATRQIHYVFPTLSEAEQTQFYLKLKEDFERYNTIAIQWSQMNPELLTQMFENQTIIKSLRFFTHQRKSLQIANKRDSSLLQQFETLKTKREQLGYFYQLPLSEVTSRGTSLKKLEEEIDKLEKSLSLVTSERMEDDGMYKHKTWSDIILKLNQDDALVEMIRFRKFDQQSKVNDLQNHISFGFTDSIYYAALIVTKEFKDYPQLIVLKDGINMETRYLSYYKNALRFSLPDQNSFNTYWAPFEPLLNGKKKIYFSADGAYHKINLNTLYKPAEETFLIENYELHLLLNPAQILVSKKTTPQAKDAVLIGDPNFDIDVTGEPKSRIHNDKFTALPGTYEEIINIDKILRYNAWKTNLYLKNAASEKNLKNTRSPYVLHLATHGFFSADIVKLNAEAKNNFLFHSGILLSGANKSIMSNEEQIMNDGIVTSYEVMNLDLSNTDLVVLSACETGLGKIENGEGVFGLQRSFLQAGARNVLISLWKVDDQSTKDLMIRFYQYLAMGHAKRSALKLAQLDQMKITHDPMLWGGFVMVGID